MEVIRGENELALTVRPSADGVTVLRCETADPAVRLPDEIGGLPVTGLGDYAFSARPPVLPDDSTPVRVTAGGAPGAHDPAGLQTVLLPDSLREIGRYAFYNCTGLRTLGLPGHPCGIGHGAFMNCALDTVLLHAPVGARTGLPALLDQLAGAVSVKWETEQGTLRLLFPPYHEELEELAAPHIFQRRIEGAGYAYRQCFAAGVLSLEEYDRAFERLTRIRETETAARIALDRLRWPVGLSRRADEAYRAFLADAAETAAGLLLEARDTAGLTFLLGLGTLGGDALARVCDRARAAGQTEALGLLLAAGRPQAAGRNRSFEL